MLICYIVVFGQIDSLDLYCNQLESLQKSFGNITFGGNLNLAY